MSDGGGTQRQETAYQTDPQIQQLQALRLLLAQGVASGNWEGMQGFFDKVLIPRTKNELTAAGLGRSGAVGEAVSNAQLAYGTDFLKSLLSGIPSSQIPSGQTSRYSPGAFDWISLIAKTAGAFA